MWRCAVGFDETRKAFLLPRGRCRVDQNLTAGAFFSDKTAPAELARSPRCAVRWPSPPGRAPPSGAARGSGVARRLPGSRIGSAVARAWHARRVAPTTAAPREKARVRRRIPGAWNRGRTSLRLRRRRVRLARGGTTPGTIRGPSDAHHARRAARGPTSTWTITASPSAERGRAGTPSGTTIPAATGTGTGTGTRTRTGTRRRRRTGDTLANIECVHSVSHYRTRRARR